MLKWQAEGQRVLFYFFMGGGENRYILREMRYAETVDFYPFLNGRQTAPSQRSAHKKEKFGTHETINDQQFNR